MTHAPHLKEMDTSNSRDAAWPSRLAQTDSTVAQELSEQERNNAYRRKSSKTRDETEPTKTANSSCPIRSKVAAPRKSP